MKIGSYFRKLREDRGISIRELSIQIGIAESHLGNIEREMKAPTLRIAVDLANFFGIGLKDCFDTDFTNDNEYKFRPLLALITTEQDLLFVYNLIIRSKIFVSEVNNGN